MYKRIVLKDHLNHPYYNWPVTMLTEPVTFSEPVKPGCWQLLDAQGNTVPFQVTDLSMEGEKVKGLNLHFLSTLAPGESKEYRFVPAEPAKAEERTDSPFVLQVEQEKKCFCVSYGDKKMICSLDFESVECRTVCSGPVFTETQIVCRNGAQTETLRIRIIRDLPFWELQETLTGFENADTAPMQITFEGFDFTRRFSWARPVEKVDAYLMDSRLPVTIMPYENCIPWYQSKYIAFGGEGLTAGLFIRDCLDWKEDGYPIWGSNRGFGITFRYEADTLKAEFPLKNGSRRVAVAVYPGEDVQSIEEMWRIYAWLDLDKTRKWILDWEEDQSQYPRFFDKAIGSPLIGGGWYSKRGEYLTPDKMTEVIDEHSGTVNGRCSPVQNREFIDWTVYFDLTADEMSQAQFDRAKAFFAFMAYMTKDENYMPTKNMLAGHPNFLADTISASGFVAALFPGHPEREMFRAYFDVAVTANLKYHIRPDVAAYSSIGGRHTESLSTYAQGNLRALIHVSALLHRCGYKSPLCCDNGAKWLNWFANTLSAPVDGRRMIPQQGAHCRVAEIPYSMNEFAQLIEAEYPEVAQNMYALCEGSPLVSFEIDDPTQDLHRTLFRRKEGGKLTLKSEKFTGYGCIFREAVGTPDEISLHVQQLDKGPNYRWGCFENTGNGGIFYYAAGKRYSFVAQEDTGDRNVGAEEGSCGFSVLKGHTYHNIGFQDMTEPMRAFPNIKSIKLLAGDDIAQYYKYRRVSLVDKDYAVMYDAVSHMRACGRFVWSVNETEEFPQIWQLQPGAKPVASQLGGTFTTGNGDDNSLPPERRSKTVTYEGNGNFLTVVSHRRDITAETAQFGAVVKLPERTDYLFEDQARIRLNTPDMQFNGYSGILSVYGDGSCSGAVLEGREIGCGDFRGALSGKGAFCFTSGEAGQWSGTVVADESCTLTVLGAAVQLERGTYAWRFDGTLRLENQPERHYDGTGGFVRDTRRHEFGFNGYDFWDTGEILTYPE